MNANPMSDPMLRVHYGKRRAAIFAATVGSACSLLACAPASRDWHGFVYPSAGDLTTSVEIGRFGTFEQCRAASLAVLETFGRSDSGAFECGRDCRPSQTGLLKVCAETRDE
jgi:hypothetical protein